MESERRINITNGIPSEIYVAIGRERYDDEYEVAEATAEAVRAEVAARIASLTAEVERLTYDNNRLRYNEQVRNDNHPSHGDVDLICQQCCGRKKLVGMFPIYLKGTPEEEKKPIIEIDCPICYGDGVVTAARMERIRRGQEIKQFRISRGLGLRECAHRLGERPSNLCEAEQWLWADLHSYDTLRNLIENLETPDA